MIAADHRGDSAARLLAVEANGRMRHLSRGALASLFSPGDVVIANDAATLPASLHGTHEASGAEIEIRLAGWVSLNDTTRFIAIAFGPGDHRTPTEDRPSPPLLSPGDRLSLGPLAAVIDRLLDHPRLIVLSFIDGHAGVSPGSQRMAGPSNMRMFPNLWFCGTCGRGLPPSPSPSSRHRPASRWTGARSRPGDRAAFISRR